MKYYFLRYRTLFIIVGSIIIGMSISAIVATASIKVPYPYTEYEPGEWIDEFHQFNTYSEPCQGYYIVDYTNKNKVKIEAYGDFSDKYKGYEEIYNSPLSTTTPIQ